MSGEMDLILKIKEGDDGVSAQLAFGNLAGSYQNGWILGCYRIEDVWSDVRCLAQSL